VGAAGCRRDGRALDERGLDAASHTPDLVQRDRIWVNLDHAQQGIGRASCGPGVLPQHRLEAVPTTFAVSLSPLGRSRA
jgi:beta-galactosidase